MPAGVAVVVPVAPPDAQSASRSTPERFAGPSRKDANAPQAAAPSLRIEPAIGVTVMRLVHDDNGAQPVPASEPAKSAPAVYEAGTETSVVSLAGPPGAAGHVEKSADASNGAATAGPAQAPGTSNSGAYASAATGEGVSATTSGGAQISFTVGDKPAVVAPASANGRATTDAAASGKHASAETQASADARASDDAGTAGGGAAPACDVQILHDKPKAAVREVATFKLDGALAERDQIMSLLKRRACEAGANALLLKKPDSTATAAQGAYHVEAVALLLESARRDHTPVPKTIEVPLPSKPVPKTITVDPDAPR